MSLRDAINRPRPRKGPPCTFAEIYAALEAKDPEEAEYLHYLMGLSPLEMSNSRIVTALRDEGYYAAASTVSRHRSKGCRCESV